MKKFAMLLFLVCAFLLFPPNVRAGEYTNEMSKCLVESTTPSSKLVLMRWLFAAMSLHPDLKSIAHLSPGNIDKVNKEMAELFMELLSKTCKTQTQKAILYEGEDSIRASFNIFGQVAARELLSNPEVASGIAKFAASLDTKDLMEMLDEIH